MISNDISKPESAGFVQHAWRSLTHNLLSLAAAIYLVSLLVLSVSAGWITPYNPVETNLQAAYLSPSAEHWFGTDQVGRDVFSRVINAAKLDFAVAGMSVLLSFLLGTFLGSAGVFYGGLFDRVVGRITDVMMTFPLFVVALAIVAALGNSVQSIVIASAVVNLPFFVRLSRAEVGRLRVLSFVEAARAGGNSEFNILLKFMIPNALPTIVVQVSTSLGWAILDVAGLSFLGLGIRPPTPEWGIMVAEAAASILAGNWWLIVFPGGALAFTVLSFNLLGDSLRDILDVRFRR
ncbi:Glutathione transport system permease protein GsiD [Ensifer psoraleae]|uniref:ABC transporter permease n=1 Tax=Sinorhizobium psoraleae TaxID=520838 RepID=UPI001568AB5B|nr:ABC transporter permease [Sinorhizobium psoraleae]NRP75633.1 Glutathione transport system permease protein GsiD [Sinorhizobium psoraleae]